MCTTRSWGAAVPSLVPGRRYGMGGLFMALGGLSALGRDVALAVARQRCRAFPVQAGVLE